MRKNDLVSKYHVAIDCIVFGFDDGHLKILLIKRSLEPEKGKWSLMGGFVTAQESADEAANRILQSDSSYFNTGISK